MDLDPDMFGNDDGSPRDDGSLRLGRNIRALLADEESDEGNDEASGGEEDGDKSHPGATTGPQSGARWRGWELKALIRNMTDLNVLDSNLTTGERKDVWEHIAQQQTQERSKQGSAAVRSAGACQNAWV